MILLLLACPTTPQDITTPTPTGTDHHTGTTTPPTTPDAAVTAVSATQDGAEIKLSHKEIEILAYLYKHRNAVVSRYDLLENVWGYEEQITTRTVDNFIARLRQKIEVNPNVPRIILTAHGSGYKMVV